MQFLGYSTYLGHFQEWCLCLRCVGCLLFFITAVLLYLLLILFYQLWLNFDRNKVENVRLLLSVLSASDQFCHLGNNPTHSQSVPASKQSDTHHLNVIALLYFSLRPDSFPFFLTGLFYANQDHLKVVLMFSLRF